MIHGVNDGLYISFKIPFRAVDVKTAPEEISGTSESMNSVFIPLH